MPWVVHKGPGDEIYEDAGVWGFPGVAGCYEENEKHLARHILKYSSPIAHRNHWSGSDLSHHHGLRMEMPKPQ